MAKQRLILEGDNRTGRAFREVNSSLTTMTSNVKKSLGSLKGLTALLAGGAFARAAKSQLDFADKVGKLNQRLGASTEFLSQMKFAAEQTGVTFETFATGLQRMQRRVSEAAQGTGEAKDALRELNIDASKLVNLSLEDQFDIISDALNGLASNSDKVRIAMRLFDTEGVSLLQTMDGGAEAVRGLRDEADQLGQTLDQGAAAKAAKANDAVNALKTGFTAFIREIAVNFAPAIEAVADFFGNVLPRAVNFSKGVFSRYIELVSTGLATLLRAMAKFAGAVGDGLDFLNLPGADSLQGIQKSLNDTAISIATFGAESGEASKQAFRFAFGLEDLVKVTNSQVPEAKKNIDELRNSVSALNGVYTSQEILDALDDKKLFGGGKADEKDSPFKGIKDSVASALVSGVESGGEGMKGALRGILQDLASQILQSQIVNILGSIFGGGSIGGLFGGGKQAGGQVGPGVYTVGESGPETLAIGQRGMVYANSMSKGGGGVSINNNIDARGADPAAAARIEAAIRRSQAETVAAVRDMKRRGRL